MTGGRAPGYTKPDPPIEVGVTEYESPGDRVAVNVRRAETGAPGEPAEGSDWRFGGSAPGDKTGIIRLALERDERSMSRARLPQ